MATNNSQQRLAYSVNQPLTAIFNPPIISNRVPTANDKQPLGTLWIVKLTNSAYVITSVVNNLANWDLVSAAAGALSQLTAEDASVAIPVAGNIVINGDGNVDTTAVGNTLTISLTASPTFAGTVTANAITVGDLTVTGDFGINSAAQIDFTSSDAAANAILLSATAGGVQILAAGSPILLSTTNQAINLVSGTGAINIGADAAAKTITIGNVTGATGVVINSGTNGVAVASTGAGDITLNSSDTLLLDSAGVLELNSSGAAISIGNDAVAQAINIGTGAAARVITIGNVSGATNLTLRSGSAGVNVNVSNNQPTNINSGTSTGLVTIGNALVSGIDLIGITNVNVAGAVDTNIASTSNSGIVNIGNSASAAVNIDGPVNVNVSVNANTAINTGTSTGTVTIGNSANTGAISLNSAAASNFSVSGAGVDLTLASALGSVIISATEVAADSIQLTTAATGGITVNASSAALIVHRAVNVDAAAGVNAFTSTSLTTGVAGIFTSSAATVDAVQLVGGGLKVAPVAPASGASPRVASGRFGVAGFTDNIAAAATVALAITNTMSTAASHVMATVQCATVGSACVIRNIDVSVAGTITCNVTNLGGTDTTGADVVITFWLLD